MATHNRQSVWVVGAIGRLGEALVNQLLARGGYRNVLVEGAGRLSSSIQHLQLVKLTPGQSITDVLLIVSHSQSQGQRSYFGRDAAFDDLPAERIVERAQQALNHGAQRLILIAPLPAWQQIAHVPRGLMNTIEEQVSRLPFRSVVIIRPVSQAPNNAVGMLQRFAQFYLQLQMLMLPRSIPTQTSEQIARSVLRLMDEDSQGVRVLVAADLAKVLPL